MNAISWTHVLMTASHEVRASSMWMSRLNEMYCLNSVGRPLKASRAELEKAYGLNEVNAILAEISSIENDFDLSDE